MSSPPRMETTEPPQKHIPWHRQPLATLYVIIQLVVLFAGFVPFWIVKFSVPSKRPSPKWSLLMSVSVFVIRNFIRIFTNAGVIQSKRDVHKLLGGGRLKATTNGNCKGLWIDPVPDENVWGEIRMWKALNGVTSKKVGAYMWGKGESDSPSVRPAEPDEKIVVHFHGGGYVMGSARPNALSTSIAQSLYNRLLHSTTLSSLTRVIEVEYSLCRAEPISTARENPFPTALLDGLAVVHYLVFTLGYHPRNIILSGDSAGGNIALALTRYLRDAPLPSSATLPSSTFSTEKEGLVSLLPGGLLLQSPWCDIASTHIPERAGPNCSFVRNAASDIVGRYPYSEERPYLGMSAYGLRGFSGGAIGRQVVATNPFMSPGSLDLPMSTVLEETGHTTPTFEGYPPVYISVGGREILYDEIMLTAERLQSHAHSDTIPPHSPSINTLTNGHSSSGFNVVSNRKSLLGARYAWVTVDEEPEMFHDFCSMPFTRTEGHRTLDGMIKWLNSLPRGTDYPL